MGFQHFYKKTIYILNHHTTKDPMELSISAAWLLCIETAIFFSKVYLLKKCISSAYGQSKLDHINVASTNPNAKKLWSWVILILFCSAFDNFQWIFKLLRKTVLLELAPNPVLWLIRLNWAMYALSYLALGLLMEKLINKAFKLKIRHYFSIAFCSIVMCYLIAIAFIQYDVVNPAERSFEYLTYRSIIFYVFFALLPALFIVLKHAYKSNLPKILKDQSKILVLCLLTPQLILSTISAIPFIVSTSIDIDNYLLIAANDILFVLALYFCARRMLGLRFLNMNTHVQSFEHYNFIDDFKTVLEQLGHVTTTQELQHITKAFFDRAFTVDVENTQLYIRDLESSQDGNNAPAEGFLTLPAVEQFLAAQDTNNELLQYLSTTKILIRDEIEFDYFYGESSLQKELITLLETIDASIFLPLYEKQTLVAYIIVRRNARPHKLFSNIERDEMLVFASYLSTVIYLLRHRNLKALMQQEKELREELYFKHQEIHHYKESIRTLLKTHTSQKLGILYFKNRSFMWGNQAARELLSQTSPHLGHMKRLALEIKKYNYESQTITISDSYGNPLMCSAFPGADKTQVLLLLFYPDIADTFTIPFETLKDLSSWDYAIYLETTKSGQLINQLIPSSTAALLNFKIDLLKIALSKEPTLLELPEGDVVPIVQIIHHISLRSTLHTLDLQRPEEQNAVALQLFGVDQLFTNEPRQESLLEKLSDTGTLFIQNVEFLARSTQDQLVAFLHSGMFQPLKSDRKIGSHVRIICSTNNNLELFVQQGLFSAELYNKLKKSSLALPSLLTIPQTELTELAQRLSEQAIKTKELNNLISLNEKETSKILDQRPVSLHEFKERVHHALINKTAKKKLDTIVEFDPAYLTTDPELSDAVRLGKHALKDRYIMRMLWNKFKNQTKIAALLNVNRSSVNRRCKEFKLISEHEN